MEDIDERGLAARVARDAGHHFDLGAGQLVRFSLLRVASDDHVLVTVLHHMVTDGWSMGVMFRDLAELYDAYSHGRSPRLADLPVQYGDFAAHQREALTDAALAADVEFWKRHLIGAPPVIELATDYPRPATQSYRGGVVRFQLDATLVRQLKVLARQCDASLFMVLLTAFAVMLHRYSGQEDIVVGTPVADRNRREIEDLIGVFSNYIPLRVDLSGVPSFREVIARVRRLCVAAYEHQHVPFEKLVEALKPERTLGAPPLFQVALVLQNLPSSPLKLPGLQVEQMPVDRATAKLDLSMLLEETDGGISGELEYCAGLFAETTARRMSEHFTRLLGALVTDADGCVAAAPFMTLAEQHRIADWSGSARVVNVASTLRAEFAAQAARTPDAVALVVGAEHLTYRELHARACQMAHHLAGIGVRREDRVAVCLPRTADLIVAILGVLEAGAAYVPIDPAHPSDRVSGMVERADARVVITLSPLAARFPATRRFVCVDRDAELLGVYPTCATEIEDHPDGLAYVIYTSGSTGVPKGVMVPHRAACSLVSALASAVYGRHRGPMNVALVAAPVFDASVQQIFGALLLGHTLHIVGDEERRDGAGLLAFFRRQQINLSDCTPSLLALMVEAGLGTAPVPLRALLVGGEALPRELVQRLPGFTITNVYGPTECGVDNTAFTTLGELTSRGPSVPIGTSLENSRVYLLDAFLRPVPQGVPGDIWIAGPCLGRGYLGDASQTAAAFRPDPFAAGERMYFSGDRGRWLETGDIEFLGRSDQQVKIRGHRIELAEVEAMLRANDAIADAAVVVERAGDDHDQLVAYVVAGAALPTVAVLRDHLEKHLPPYMIPASFRMLSRLPL
ncbi:MAG TPA: amino acid adenylation domain-containing protein, partial [Vicinamibacterales bacterium]